jgi:hypothetical protein
MRPAETAALTDIRAILADLHNAPLRHLTQEQLAQLRHLRRRAARFVQYRLRQLPSDQERAGRAARSAQARLDDFAAAPGEVEPPAAPVQAGVVEAQAPPPAAPETGQAATPSPAQLGAPGPPIEVVPGGGAAPPGIEEHMGRLAAVIGDPNAVRILAVVNQDALSGEQKMVEILRIDQRFKAKDSNEWSVLLGVSPPAVRGYDTWKRLQRAKGCDD